MALSPSSQRPAPSANTATANARARPAKVGDTIGERRQLAQRPPQAPAAPTTNFLTKVRNFFGISRADFVPNAQFTTGAAPTSGLSVLGNAARMRPKTSDRDLVDYLDQIAVHGSRAVRQSTA